MLNRKIGFVSFFISSVLLAIPRAASAICPICTAAVGAGVLATRYYGIDDTIAGVWVGGLLISTAFWTDNWMAKKKIKIHYQRALLVAGYFLLIILPLYWKGIIGHPMNRICGADKLLVGIIFGSLAFMLGTELNLKLKERNGGHVYFPFQKVVLAIAPLILASIVFYVISKC